MRKLIVTLLIGGLMISMSACGNKANTEATNVTETVVEETATEAPTAEPTEAPTLAPTAEPTPEPTEEPVEEFTADMAMEKVTALFSARNELFNATYEDLNFLLFTESFGQAYIKEFGITTKDGLLLDTYGDWDTTGRGVTAITTINYFYDYVNNNCGYYSFEEYVTTHTEDEIRSYLNIKLEGQDTNQIIMFEGLAALEYLLDNFENLTCGELLSGDECTANPISGIEVAYELPLLINGTSCGAKAVFDAEGNMLNIVTSLDDGWDSSCYLDCWDDIEATKQ